jgi:type IV pilus assembly protein PilE
MQLLTDQTHGRIRPSGFRLIELMIAVAIVGVLAAIAYPSYQDHVRKARRADARASLAELAQFMERWYTSNGRYRTAGGQAPALPYTEAPKDGSTKYYDLRLDADSLSDVAFTLEAEPKAAMAGDGCGTLRLSSTGVLSRSGALPEAQCWSR